MAKYPGPISFAAFTGPSSPLLLDAGSNDQPARGLKACPQTWGVEAITLSAGGKRSTSYADRGHDAVAAGRDADGRFYFAPKSDAVTIAWRLKNPSGAETLRLELFAAGNGVPVWQRTLAAGDAQRGAIDGWDGSFPHDEWVAQARFPHDLVTVEHSPYMLKATAEGSAEEGFVERWTYFDVLVEKIELRWGGVGRIPAGRPTGVSDNYQARTIADERALVARLANLTTGTGAVDAGVRYAVDLPSNQFPRTVDEQKNDAMFAGHRDQWGDGPRIPLVAGVWVRAADDSGVFAGDTAKALGKAKFLWDWEGEDELTQLDARYPHDALKDFLRDTLDYKRNDGTCPPNSTNCHVEHGGKRGGAAVFIAQGAFALTRGTRRVWASLSEAALTGDDAGLTGVTFQPSRMSRDTYRVTVYLASERAGAGAAVDVVDAAAALKLAHEDLPFAATGVFEVKRVVRSRYVRKAPAVEVADLAASTTEYGRAGLVLDWAAGPADENLFHAQYNEYVARILEDRLHNEANVAQAGFKKPAADLVRGLADAFEGIDQFTGGTLAGTPPAFTAHSWEVFSLRQKVDAIRWYVREKPRKINGPKRKYNKWRAAHPLPADDSQWLLDFYDDLSAKRKLKVDARLSSRSFDRGCSDAEGYKKKLQTASMQGFKVVAGQQLNATAEDGFICFHCFDSLQFRRPNGTLVEAPSSVGGLAPSDSTTVDRKKAINLMYLPHTVPLNRIGVPNVYDVSVSPIIKHEVGHNFYLVHAPAAHDAPREAGGFEVTFHDAADLRCLMNYDTRSDHLCGLCNVRLRGWALKATSGGGFVDLSNVSATNRVP